MDRPILYTGSGIRAYDNQTSYKLAMLSHGANVDALLGYTFSVVAGATITANATANKAVNVGAGYVVIKLPIDPTAQGSITVDTTQSTDTVLIPSQSFTVSVPSAASGYSITAYLYAVVTLTDAIPADDPSGGLQAFWNSSNPSAPLYGQSGSGLTLPTRRTRTVTVTQVNSASYASGTTAPSVTVPTNGVSLGSIVFASGVTTISVSQITTGSRLAGLLNQHHTGVTGQAPKIVLTNAAEVQGTLPIANVALPTTPISNTTIYGPTTIGAAPTTFNNGTIPTNARLAQIICWSGGGPGGNGGGSNSGGGGGGSGGAYVEGWYAVTPGQSFYLTAGAPTSGSSITINNVNIVSQTGGNGGALGGSTFVAGNTAFGQTQTCLLTGGLNFAGQTGGNGITTSGICIGGAGGACGPFHGTFAQFGICGNDTVGNAGGNGNGGSGGVGNANGGVGGAGGCSITFFS